MSELTNPKLERMAFLMASGLSQGRAYKEAFGSSGADATVRTKSSQIIKKYPEIRARVEELNLEFSKGLHNRRGFTKQDLLDRLVDVIQDPEAPGRDIVQAGKLMAEMAGWTKDAKMGTEAQEKSLLDQLDLKEGKLPKGKDVGE